MTWELYKSHWVTHSQSYCTIAHIKSWSHTISLHWLTSQLSLTITDYYTHKTFKSHVQVFFLLRLSCTEHWLRAHSENWLTLTDFLGIPVSPINPHSDKWKTRLGLYCIIATLARNMSCDATHYCCVTSSHVQESMSRDGRVLLGDVTVCMLHSNSPSADIENTVPILLAMCVAGVV
jgi:hypothetical protein